MPRYDLSTEQAWHDLYDYSGEPWGHPGTRPEVRLPYVRWAVMQTAREHAVNLTRVLGYTTTTRLLVFGCGMGWFMEVMRDELLVGTVSPGVLVGIDLSPWIHAKKSTVEDDVLVPRIRAAGLNEQTGDGLALLNTYRGAGGPRAKLASSILNEDMASGGSRGRVRSALGGSPFNFQVLSYDGLSNSMTDAELTTASSRIHATTSGRVVHHVHPTWVVTRTLQQWKALLPADTFVMNGTWEVL